MIIGKLGFGKDDFYYGLELCLHKAGRIAYSVTPSTAVAVDVLLVTMFWYRDVYNLESFLRKAGLRKGTGKPLLIAGGMQATATPELISRMVDYVFVGDGDDSLGVILDQIEQGREPDSPYLVTEKTEKIPEPAECDPIPFAMSKGGKRDVLRIEIARGCRFKCNFCMLAHLKPYREVRAADAIRLLEKHENKTVSFFAPDRTSHSEWPAIRDSLVRLKRRDLGQDSRLEKIDDIVVNTVTFGLEGISYRLRKAVRKGYRNDFVLEMLEKFVNKCNGIALISVYFIADLPGENDEDWSELWSLFEQIEKADWSRRLTLKPVLNPLSPKKFTDYNGTLIHPFRPYGEKWKAFLRKGGNGQWGFRIIESMVWGPLERVADLIVQEGGARAYNLIQKLPNRFLSSGIPGEEKAVIAEKLFQAATGEYGLVLNAETHG